MWASILQSSRDSKVSYFRMQKRWKIVLKAATRDIPARTKWISRAIYYSREIKREKWISTN